MLRYWQLSRKAGTSWIELIIVKKNVAVDIITLSLKNFLCSLKYSAISLSKSLRVSIALSYSLSTPCSGIIQPSLSAASWSNAFYKTKY